MEIEHTWADGPEILKIRGIDCAEVNLEIKSLQRYFESPEGTGSALDENGNPQKSNTGVFLNKVYASEYNLVSASNRVCSEIVQASKAKQYTPNSIFCGLYTATSFEVLVSRYANNGHYKPHRDTSRLTLLLWPSKKTFAGGDLILSEFGVKVPYEEGMAIMFPSHYMHEVTKVELSDDDSVRDCVSAFIV